VNQKDELIHDDEPAMIFPPLHMTLRDWFAGQCPTMTVETAGRLLGWPSDLPMGDHEEDEDYQDTKLNRWKELTALQQAALEAQWSYIYADAMLAERSKK